MITYNEIKTLALSFEETEESPHFEKTSFRVKSKIFATLDTKANILTIKLSDIDQSVFTGYDNTIIYKVPNKWGNQGWTQINLNKVREDLLKDALRSSYCEVAPKKLAEKYQLKE